MATNLTKEYALLNGAVYVGTAVSEKNQLPVPDGWIRYGEPIHKGSGLDVSTFRNSNHFVIAFPGTNGFLLLDGLTNNWGQSKLKATGFKFTLTPVISRIQQNTRWLLRLTASLSIYLWLGMLPVQAMSFDCNKAVSDAEKLICKEYGYSSSLDDELSITYRWALMRVGHKQKVIQEQRDWLKNIRNACKDRLCLSQAYEDRIAELKAQLPTKKCYTLIPHKYDLNVRPIEPVCRAMEKNLNQFCDQPPMACGLKIASEFRGKIALPHWTPIGHPEKNGDLIESFIRMPWRKPYIPQQQVDDLLREKRTQIAQAITEKRLVFSTAQLDLYNLGKPQQAYRLDYGDCQARNPQFADRTLWSKTMQQANVEVQLTPEAAETLSRQYSTVEETIRGDIFTYGGKTYSYMMFGLQDRLECVF